RGAVVVRLGEAGVDERHLVHVAAEVREDLRHHLAALAARGELERRLHQAAHFVGEEAGELVEARQLLAGALRQFRLVVPRVDVARTAVREDPDHRLGTRLEVGRARRKRVPFVPRQQLLLAEQARQPEEPDPVPGPRQQLPPGTKQTVYFVPASPHRRTRSSKEGPGRNRPSTRRTCLPSCTTPPAATGTPRRRTAPSGSATGRTRDGRSSGLIPPSPFGGRLWRTSPASPAPTPPGAR